MVENSQNGQNSRSNRPKRAAATNRRQIIV